MGWIGEGEKVGRRRALFHGSGVLQGSDPGESPSNQAKLDLYRPIGELSSNRLGMAQVLTNSSEVPGGPQNHQDDTDDNAGYGGGNGDLARPEVTPALRAPAGESHRPVGATAVRTLALIVGRRQHGSSRVEE